MKNIIYIFILLLFFTTLHSCMYKNTDIPELEKITIDTILTDEDTSGFIYGKIYYDGASLGSVFQVFTIDNYNNSDSILSITTAHRNHRLFMYLNDTTLGVYNASTNLNLPKTCLILFDANATNVFDQLITLNVGNITLNSFDPLTKIYRGSINVVNSGGPKTYDIRGTLAFKMRN